jgi:hypothetical protein
MKNKVFILVDKDSFQLAHGQVAMFEDPEVVTGEFVIMRRDGYEAIKTGIKTILRGLKRG